VPKQSGGAWKLPARISVTKAALTPAAVGSGAPPKLGPKRTLTMVVRLPKGLAPESAPNSAAALAGAACRPQRVCGRPVVPACPASGGPSLSALRAPTEGGRACLLPLNSMRATPAYRQALFPTSSSLAPPRQRPATEWG
jgi:hypothetical protein